MKRIFLAGALVIFCIAGMAQDTLPEIREKKERPSKPPLSERIYFGGGLGLSFGAYTMIAVYPMIGYKFTPKLSGGLELGYEYISDKRYSQTYNTSNYGGSLFTRYRLSPSLFLHAEYAMYNYEFYYIDMTTSREWVPFLFLGAGYATEVAPGIWALASVKFDVLQSRNSPYGEWEPFFNIGVSAGF
ncbi:MAG: hypothetical protein JXA03_12715 [Bacteroidales bacterium]|nr:hypothetical protein [Bacteroidales bacterium]